MHSAQVNGIYPSIAKSRSRDGSDEQRGQQSVLKSNCQNREVCRTNHVVKYLIIAIRVSLVCLWPWRIIFLGTSRGTDENVLYE